MDEPQLRVWMQESVAPSPRHRRRAGRWVTEPSWPSPAIDVRVAGDRRSRPRSRRRGRRRAELRRGLDATRRSTPATGARTARPADEPPDQRDEDGRSLCLDSDPLSERLELLGRPVAVLELTADKPLALVAVRLCDVAPDGSSLLLTRGVLNLTHRDSHEHPEPVPVGERIDRARRAQRARTGDARRATGCGFRSRRATGRGSGRRPSRSRSRCTPPARAASSCPCVRRARRRPTPASFAEPESGAPLPVEALPGDSARASRLARGRHRAAPSCASTRTTRQCASSRTGIELEHLMEDTTRSSTAIRSRRRSRVPLDDERRARRLAHAHREREHDDGDGGGFPRDHPARGVRRRDPRVRALHGRSIPRDLV